MQTPYTFIWLNDAGEVAAIDSANCHSDADALRAAHALLSDDDLSHRWGNCGRIETYAGARFVQQVQRVPG